MKNFSTEIAFILLILIMSSFIIQKDFAGKIMLTVNGSSNTFSDLTHSDSRVSLQDKGISIYILNPKGEGTLVEITMLSNKIYESNSHTFEIGAQPKRAQTIMDIYNKPSEERNETLRFKFRRIDDLEKENYISVHKGKAEVEYDDTSGNISISFNGEDKNGTTLSGSLSLKNPYLIDRRD